MQIDSQDLAAALPGKILVDIRQPDEWRTTGIIEGSHLLTFTGEDVGGWLEALAEVSKPEDDLVLVCRTGHRTGFLLDFLVARTPYKQAAHLSDGILGWISNGLPVAEVKE